MLYFPQRLSLNKGQVKTCMPLVFNMISQTAKYKIQISELVCSEMFTNQEFMSFLWVNIYHLYSKIKNLVLKLRLDSPLSFHHKFKSSSELTILNKY